MTSPLLRLAPLLFVATLGGSSGCPGSHPSDARDPAEDELARVAGSFCEYEYVLGTVPATSQPCEAPLDAPEDYEWTTLVLGELVVTQRDPHRSVDGGLPDVARLEVAFLGGGGCLGPEPPATYCPDVDPSVIPSLYRVEVVDGLPAGYGCAPSYVAHGIPLRHNSLEDVVAAIEAGTYCAPGRSCQRPDACVIAATTTGESSYLVRAGE